MNTMFPTLTEEFRIRRLEPPTGRVTMVLDTDTYNEIDDQFAVVYAMLSQDKLNLKALYAAPFHNKRSDGPRDGMEKSYEEICRIVEHMQQSADGFVYRGSESYLPAANQPVDSPAARDLVRRAMEAPMDEPLYVAAIGAITNVASAILLEPKIIEKIVVVWLGGHDLHWRDTKEFNLAQDIHAARVVLDSGVPLMLVPCYGVTSHLITTLPEIRHYVQGRGSIGDFLTDRFEGCADDHYGYSRVIWDISVIAWLIDAGHIPSDLVHSPIVTDQLTWSLDPARHLIRKARFANRNSVFRDFFQKLEQAYRKH
jgi:hypothetical protein